VVGNITLVQKFTYHGSASKRKDLSEPISIDFNLVNQDFHYCMLFGQTVVQCFEGWSQDASVHRPIRHRSRWPASMLNTCRLMAAATVDSRHGHSRIAPASHSTHNWISSSRRQTYTYMQMSHFKQAAGSEKWTYGSRRNQQKKVLEIRPRRSNAVRLMYTLISQWVWLQVVWKTNADDALCFAIDCC